MASGITNNLLQTTTISPGDRGKIRAVNSRIEAIYQVDSGGKPSGVFIGLEGWRSPLHLARDRAYDALIENPTNETREAFHAAEDRLDRVTLSHGKISTACGIAVRRESLKLVPVVEALLADAQARLASDATRHRAALSKDLAGPLAGGEIELLEGKVATAAAELAAELETARTCPWSWLALNGLLADPK